MLQQVTPRPAARPKERPFITLTYAQSLDGCITFSPLKPMALSGSQSRSLTHHLRAAHDAILVGIRTVLADDPRLNVRLVKGRSPWPVVLDGRLRLPLKSRLLNNGARRPWVATSDRASAKRQAALEARGAEVSRLPVGPDRLILLDPLLASLRGRGVTSIMVEGGARVLTSFMRARLVDQVIITVAPLLVGGVHAFGKLERDPTALPRLAEACCAQFGPDLVIHGHPVWED
jgi:3,4-dihydroxy 2-butanone 4-phosphate synthase/GTP cyclohydrolase II